MLDQLISAMSGTMADSDRRKRGTLGDVNLAQTTSPDGLPPGLENEHH
jgi:hypothetical protein